MPPALTGVQGVASLGPMNQARGSLHNILCAALCLLLLSWPDRTARAATRSTNALPSEIGRFIRDKEAHARQLEKQLNLKASEAVWDFIRSAARNAPAVTTNAFEKL